MCHLTPKIFRWFAKTMSQWKIRCLCLEFRWNPHFQFPLFLWVQLWQCQTICWSLTVTERIAVSIFDNFLGLITLIMQTDLIRKNLLVGQVFGKKSCLITCIGPELTKSPLLPISDTTFENSFPCWSQSKSGIFSFLNITDIGPNSKGFLTPFFRSFAVIRPIFSHQNFRRQEDAWCRSSIFNCRGRSSLFFLQKIDMFTRTEPTGVFSWHSSNTCYENLVLNCENFGRHGISVVNITVINIAKSTNLPETLIKNLILCFCLYRHF